MPDYATSPLPFGFTLRANPYLAKTKTVCKETPIQRPNARNRRAMRRWYRLRGAKRVYTTVPGDMYVVGNTVFCHPSQYDRILLQLRREGLLHA